MVRAGALEGQAPGPVGVLDEGIVPAGVRGVGEAVGVFRFRSSFACLSAVRRKREAAITPVRKISVLHLSFSLRPREPSRSTRRSAHRTRTPIATAERIAAETTHASSSGGNTVPDAPAIAIAGRISDEVHRNANARRCDRSDPRGLVLWLPSMTSSSREGVPEGAPGPTLLTLR